MRLPDHLSPSSLRVPNSRATPRLAALVGLVAVSLFLAGCGDSTTADTTLAADTTPVESVVDTAAPAESTPAETSPPEATPETTPETTPVDTTAPTETAAPASATTLAIGSSDTTPVAASSDSLDGTWEIVDGSEAGYRVPEVLNGQETEGVGRTKAITGSMTVAGTTVTTTEFSFDLTKLASDSERRDAQVQTRIMDTAKFPNATFVLSEPIDVGKVPADKEEVKIPAKGTLTLHGTTKPIDIELTARRNGANVEVLGSYALTFADFGIPDPSFKPFVEVGKTGSIEWLLVFAKK